MGFVTIEAWGKRAFEQFPFIKHSAKRLYHMVSYALSSEKFKAEGNVVRVTPDDGYEYFYGYYDKSPWDATGRYMIAIKVRQTYKSVAPKEPGEVVLVDTQNGNKILKVGITHSWNVQQSCMAQWLGPDFKSRLIYNDYRDGRYCSVVFNVEQMKEERVLPRPVYDVARDGSFALSLDFNRLHRMRPGYGYSNEPDRWYQNGKKHIRLVTCNIDKTDMYNLSDDVFVSHCYWKNDKEILSFLRKKDTGDHYYLMKDKSQEYQLLWPELNTDGHCSYSPDGKYIITDTYPNRKRLASVFLCREDGYCKRIARVFAPFRYDFECRCDLHPRWNRNGKKICIDSVHEAKRALYTIALE